MKEIIIEFLVSKMNDAFKCCRRGSKPRLTKLREDVMVEDAKERGEGGVQ